MSLCRCYTPLDSTPSNCEAFWLERMRAARAFLSLNHLNPDLVRTATQSGVESSRSKTRSGVSQKALYPLAFPKSAYNSRVPV